MVDDICTPLSIVLLLWTLTYLLSREVDENGMDSYDHSFGIAGEGRERGITGIIYTNGRADFWANLGDHNPYWN